ncbi:MAG: hypothetical protein ABSH10_05670 [Phycisphaerae bacterium]
MRWWKRHKAKASSESSPVVRRLVRGVVWLAVLAAAAAGSWYGMRRLEPYVTGRAGGSGMEMEKVRTVRVAFTELPDWMPRPLARDVALSLVPSRAKFTDEDLAANVYKLAAANPHIATVFRVSKRLTADPNTALVEIDCRFRMPVARIDLTSNKIYELGQPRDYVYVDREGVRLPAADVPQWMIQAPPAPGQTKGRWYFYRDGDPLPTGYRAAGVHYITIRGVKAAPPAVGRVWEGQDVQDGLRLVSLMLTRSYANQITTVDVRNDGGRISRFEPQLRLYAQVGDGPATDIRFGRFAAPGGGDYEVAPEVKMSYLDDYFLEHGNRLAGLNSYIDLQYDQLIYSVN